jgi:DNA polymerase-1
VDEKVLKNIGTPFTESILRYRTYNKQKTTYYENMRDLMFPNGFIYPSLNHVATKTGRLSCTKPNIQNQTEEGGIKGAYVSRWGHKGRLVEFDYSQLEMVALAYLANDRTLIADIGGGKDMHTELFIDMYSRSPTKEERKWFKRLSFGLVYGAGARTLAENAGCTVAEAKKFISVFYGRYPGVQIWHEETYGVAKKQRKVSKEHCPVSKRPVGKYVMNTPTTRRYVFKEYFNEW